MRVVARRRIGVGWLAARVDRPPRSLRPAPERLINSIGRHLLQPRRYVRVDVGRYLIGRVPERLLHDLEGHTLGDEEARRPAPKLVEGEVPHAAGLRAVSYTHLTLPTNREV